MKYWNDDCDTWAAENLEDLAKEQYEQGLIDDYSFNQDDWGNISSFEMAWVCDLGDAIHEKRRGRFHYLIAKIKWYRPLWWIFLFHRSGSHTNKAWFICSTEY